MSVLCDGADFTLMVYNVLLVRVLTEPLFNKSLEEQESTVVSANLEAYVRMLSGLNSDTELSRKDAVPYQHITISQ